jgi:diguanylate cyclase (GGDEF)-like protein/PAS domain S-box-containing protein
VTQEAGGSSPLSHPSFQSPFLSKERALCFPAKNRTAMTRDTGGRPRLTDALGVGIAVLAALLLSVVLLRIVHLGREAGLDRDALTRERVAVAETAKIVATLDALADFRNALILRAPNVLQTRAAADARLADIRADFTSGPASMFRAQNEWALIDREWSIARRHPGGASALEGIGPVMTRIGALLILLEDRSGLTYDPSVTAQDLADTYMQASIFAINGTRRLESTGYVAIAQSGLDLRQRLSAAGSLMNLRSAVDLTRDELPLVVARLDELIPDRRSEWEQLPQLAQQMSGRTNDFADLMIQSVMLQRSPAVDAAQIRRGAATAIDAGRRLNAFAGAALDASLEARGRIQSARNRYLYLAFVLGAIFVVGVMMTIAQLAARRDRAALRSALREQARLQAELARQKAEEALRLSEAQFRAVFAGAAVAIAIVDRNAKVLDANDTFRMAFGDSIETALEGRAREFNELWTGERETFEFEAQVRAPAGHEVWTDATLSIVMDEQQLPRFAICMFRDKTELKQTERRIAHSATHDALTGLPNRALFEEQLRRRFEDASALLDSFFAVLFVDLEHFAEINESLGHAAGDLVLTQIATRLRAAVDSRDVVARLGGDEFAVLLQSLGDILHVESIARRILNNMQKSIAIGSNAVFLGASIGIAVASSSYERAEDVIRDAEIAMQHAKESGGSRFALFDSTMHERAQQRLQLISDLRLAVERREFRMVYQPIFSLDDGAIQGAEALVRWDHPTEGVLYPSDFVPLAEQTGLAHVLGRFVVESTAEQLAAWRRNREGKLEFGMHVNVSAAELSDPEFERTVVQTIERHGLRPDAFTLEITESVVLDPGTRANQTILRMRERGFKICIDDFGTGYSSLRYLQQFEVDAIKIDRSFVAGVDGRLASEPIVRTILALAEAYNVRVVAEGVETAQQREMLRNAGCRFAQGFLYAQPLTPAELARDFPDVLGRVERPA